MDFNNKLIYDILVENYNELLLKNKLRCGDVVVCKFRKNENIVGAVERIGKKRFIIVTSKGTRFIKSYNSVTQIL
jgi:hypothetical protein